MRWPYRVDCLLLTIILSQQEPYVHAEEFKQVKHIGKGQYGDVWKMEHAKLPCMIAVKKIVLNTSLNEKERRRWKREIEVLRKSVDHPHTVTFYGALVHNGDVWLCMELMDRSLDDLVKLIYQNLNTTIPQGVIRNIIFALVNGLNYLKEELEVLHRDVKPSNILINKHGEVKLCDFGISGVLQKSVCYTNIGCARFMAPERIDPMLGAQEGEQPKFDARSDVWSLGLTLFELVVGHSAFPEFKTPFQKIEYIVDRPAPRLPEDLQGVNEDCRQFIHACLTKDVNKRPKYKDLLEHPLLGEYQYTTEEMKSWYQDLMKRLG